MASSSSTTWTPKDEAERDAVVLLCRDTAREFNGAQGDRYSATALAERIVPPVPVSEREVNANQRAEAAEAIVADYTERELACCPENTSFDEYIGTLQKRVYMAEGKAFIARDNNVGLVKRAEAAEAELDAALDEGMEASEREGKANWARIHAEAERDALRKDAARYREAIDIFLSFQGSTREPEGQAALDAALAVQPNALRAQEGA